MRLAPPGELAARLDAEPPLRSLKLELLQLIATQARWVPVAVMGAALPIAWMISPSVGWTMAGAWALAVLVTTTLHWNVVTRLPALGRWGDDARLTAAAVSFVVNGSMQVSVIASFPELPLAMCMLLTIYCMSLQTGLVAGVAGYPKIFVPYSVVTLGAAVTPWALGLRPDVESREQIVIVGITIVYTLMMWVHAFGAFRIFTNHYRLRTERLELARELGKALTQAEQANAAKTRFLASASHDLRQPIHALSLFSGALSMRPLDARTAVIAEQIGKALGVLESQLDALLDISRLDAGVVEKNLSVIDLKAMLEQLHQEFLPQADRKQLLLKLDCEGSPRIRSDAGLLLRVLRNLMSNAIKYTAAGSVRVVARIEGAFCLLGVIDTGQGIPDDEQQRVFDEFYQLHNPSRDRSNGLGLGLAIVRRLTALLEIELQLRSTVGEGSCFELRLPLGRAAENTGAVASEVRAANDALRVLVIDDEEAIRAGMEILLGEMGFEVVLAGSTAEALRLGQQLAPALVLADFRLQGDDDGLKAIAALRRLWPGLPALLVSGDTAPDRLLQARDAGIPLLHKPVPAALLRRTILEAVAAR